jgi:Tfp pilus assembly protein PilF
MSVLYKALQKAEKENEARQSASSDTTFDTQRLAASGALKFAGGRGRAINRVVLAAIVVVAVGGGTAFLMFKESLMPAPAPQVASAPAPVEPVLQPPAPEAAAPPAEPAPAESVAAPAAPEVTPAPPAPTESAAPTQVAAATEAPPAAPSPAPAAPAPADSAETPAPQAPAEKQVAAAPPKPPAAPARPVPQRPEGMPQIPVDSPARMLNPPIAINRSEFALAGVGNQVQVREVSQAARSNVAAGYDALLRGSYDTALGFYDSALTDEPTSVLALLGRGASLQKLGRGPEAQASYEAVLKIDPQNREALSNLTTIVAERSPQDALTQLLELERQYPNFSPVKAQIGLTYAKSGSMAPAVDYFRRALALSPETVMYHYNLALVLDHLGRREQAVASYERVLASISGGRGPADLSPVDIERRVRFLRTR